MEKYKTKLESFLDAHFVKKVNNALATSSLHKKHDAKEKREDNKEKAKFPFDRNKSLEKSEQQFTNQKPNPPNTQRAFERVKKRTDQQKRSIGKKSNTKKPLETKTNLTHSEEDHLLNTNAAQDKFKRKRAYPEATGITREQAMILDNNEIMNLNKLKRQSRGNKLGVVAEKEDFKDMNPEMITELFNKRIEDAKKFMIEKDLNTNTQSIKEVIDVNEPITLKDLSTNYKISEKELNEVLKQVSGSLEDLEKLLKGEQVKVWTELEDIALSQPQDTIMYQCLVKNKGEEAIEKRRKYLETLN